MTHDELVKRGAKWLRSIGCKVVFKEFFGFNSERPDVIGWYSGRSILIECKASRADFLKDKNKLFRKYPERGMGDWRIYLCPPNIINPVDLPENWGLLWVYPKMVRRISGIPKANIGWWDRPFVGNRDNEAIMLVSALRRFEVRGVFDLIYDPVGR